VSILDWNRRKVQSLTGWEIWFFILGRVLVGFALGALAMWYFPQIALMIAIPAGIIGLVLLIIAAKGLRRRQSASSESTI
jgi:Na+/melibiose symporter-like transporter